MAKPNPILRFDHREIAVLFSLFIFVSLLMFTVGILVGKGLTQHKYEGSLPGISKHADLHVPMPLAEHGGHAAPGESHGNHAAATPQRQAASVDEHPTQNDPLELIPQKEVNRSHTGGSLREGKEHAGVNKALANPKVSSVVEGGPGLKKQRQIASGKIPVSFAEGPFTVQVGSYPTEKDAEDRAAELRKRDFPHAYVSVTELGELKKKWYRVALGYFKDATNAEIAGQILQDRKEVRNYIVRKNDAAN